MVLVFLTSLGNITDMNIDLKYLQKNLDLKRFVKLLDKITKWTNEKEIEFNFYDCCTSKEYPKISYSQITKDAMEKIEKLMWNGKFFETISSNFKIESSISKKSKRYADMSYQYQLVRSDINKVFYVTVYQFYDNTNDSYFVTYKSKDKKDALEKMKALSKKPIYLISDNQITYDD